MIKAKSIGIVGLGSMGMRMAKNLLAQGFPVTGFDVDAEKYACLAKQGLMPAKTCAELALHSDVIIVMVFNDEQVWDVCFGADSLSQGLSVGKTVIFTSTMESQTVINAAEKLNAIGVDALDAPVTGGVSKAEAGSLTIMVGGKAEVLEEQRDVFDCIGGKIVHAGEVGLGQATKIANQVLVGITHFAMAEALVLGTKLGVKPEVLLDVLDSGSAGSPLLTNWAPKILARDFHVGSRMDTILKDLKNAMKSGYDSGVPLFLTSTVYELYKLAYANADKTEDWTAIIKTLEEAAGITVSKSNV